jgi:hypothetical protein
MAKTTKRAPRISRKIAPLSAPDQSVMRDDVEQTLPIAAEVDDDPLSEDARYQNIVLTHEYLFDRDFPEEYEKVKALIKKYNTDITDDELRFKLGELVYRHRRRHSDPKYKKRIDDIVNNAKLVSDLISKMWDDLAQVDHEYRDLVLAITNKSISKNAIGIDFPGSSGKKLRVAQSIAIAQHIVSSFHQALELGEKVTFVRASLTRPKTPYTLEAYTLSELWFILTGQQVVYPKSVQGEASPHDSTEFVRLCVKMIDAKSTRSQVHISIIRAREKRKEYLKLLQSDESAGLVQAIQSLID